MPYQQNASKNVLAVEQVKGAHRRTLVDGERMMIIEWTMEAGAGVPLHQHPHEQCGYVVSGEMIFTAAGKEHSLTPGMGYLVTGNEPHSARFPVPTIVIDIFSPPREDYRGTQPSSYHIVAAPAPKRKPTTKKTVVSKKSTVKRKAKK
jgi:quercetin dioxygenase-like cupin family protein